jgi:hypothetical protein
MSGTWSVWSLSRLGIVREGWADGAIEASNAMVERSIADRLTRMSQGRKIDRGRWLT